MSKLNPFSPLTPADETIRRNNAILAEEDVRRDAIAAKTARLRELRLANEAAERAAAPKATPKPQTKGGK
jgi:hypothetical protein